MVRLQLKGLLELFVKKREFLPGLGFHLFATIPKAVKCDVKTNPFLLSIFSINVFK